MAQKFEFKSHTPVSKDGQLKGYRVNPYIRLRSGEKPPVMIQGGKFYGAGGEELEDVGEWVNEAVRQMTPAARESVGLPKNLDAKVHSSLKK